MLIWIKRPLYRPLKIPIYSNFLGLEWKPIKCDLCRKGTKQSFSHPEVKTQESKYPCQKQTRGHPNMTLDGGGGEGVSQPF